MYSIKETGQQLDLKQRLDSGGEGAIWLTNIPEIVAKIYHTPRKDYEHKVSYMADNPPEDPTKSQNHTSIAWPQGLVLDDDGHFCGFIMPRVSGSLKVNHVYNTKLRKRNAPGFNWHYLHVTAYNISSIMEALHAKGYVVGDIKTDNFMINDRALVAITDTDSFQIKDSQSIYRCSVGSEGFTPPELIGKNLSEIDRSEVHDRFGLAVIIHLLLLGYHPFNGEWPEGQEPETRDEAILKGEWPYAPNAKVQSPVYALPQTILHPKIQQAFLKTFNEGFIDPLQRTTASEWKSLLTEVMKELKTCHENSQHFRFGALCYWCERKSTTGLDVFPEIQGQANSEDMVKLEQTLQTEDLREIARLWHTNPDLHKESRFVVHKDTIQKACDYIQVLDQFKEFCAQGKSDQEILDWWGTDDKLSYFPLAPTERVNGKPLKEFLDEVRRRRQALSQLKEAISRAAQKDSFGDAIIHEDFERHILEVYAQHQWPEHMKTAEAQLFDRVDLARQRIESWVAFKDAYANNKQAAALHLWAAHKETYQKLGLNDAYKKFLQDARVNQSLVQALKESLHQNDAQVAAWGDKHAPLMDLDFLDEEVNGVPLRNHVAQAQDRMTLLQKLKKANEKSDLQLMAKLWDPKICEGRPEFEAYLPKIEVAQTLATTWRKVYRAIQEDQTEVIVENWDDEKFAPLLNEADKIDRVRQAFQRYYTTVQFDQPRWQQIQDDKDFITVRWPWPSANARIPHCLITLSLNATAPSYDDNQCLYRVLIAKEGAIGQARLPKLRQGKLHIHIWPVVLVCGKPVILGNAREIVDMELSHLQYTTDVKKANWRGFGKGFSHKILIKFQTQNLDTLPRMRLMATEHRFPIPQDPEAKIVAEVLPTVIGEEKTHKVEVPLEFTLNEAWEYRLEIIDPMWKNKIQLHHPYQGKK